MQVPQFSPRISLIEIAPRLAPRSGCPGRPTLFVTTDKERAPQGTGSDWKNLLSTAQFLSTQTNTTMFALIYKILGPSFGFLVMAKLGSWVSIVRIILFHYNF
jgi:hypothetical protein